MYAERIDKLIGDFLAIEFAVESFFKLPEQEKEKSIKSAEILLKKHRAGKDGNRFNRMINYLEKGGLVVKKEVNGKKMIFVTQKGMKKSLAFSLRHAKKEKRKDGKLVLMVFDIPEKSRSIRYLLRSVLRNLGYRMIQKSVWASSYDVAQETRKFLDLYSLSGYAKVFLCENT